MALTLSQAFLALGLLLGGSAALAQPVKCVDASGKVRYLDASAMGQEKCTPVKPAVNVITPQAGQAPAAGSTNAAAKDSQARIERAERALAQAKEKLAEQEATRSGGERNYARVEARLKPYQDAVEKAQKDVEQARRNAR
jgi:type VI protein secretion system component VasK